MRDDFAIITVEQAIETQSQNGEKVMKKSSQVDPLINSTMEIKMKSINCNKICDVTKFCLGLFSAFIIVGCAVEDKSQINSMDSNPSIYSILNEREAARIHECQNEKQNIRENADNVKKETGMSPEQLLSMMEKRENWELQEIRNRHLIPNPFDQCRQRLSLRSKSGPKMSYEELYQLERCTLWQEVYSVDKIDTDEATKDKLKSYKFALLQHLSAFFLCKKIDEIDTEFETLLVSDYHSFGSHFEEYFY